MKNPLLIFNVVLAVALIVLYALVLRHNTIHCVDENVFGRDSTQNLRLPIAYVDVDSLLLNYQLAIESNEALMKKQEDSRLNLNVKARQLQEEMAEFQRKLENNAFLSRERAESEQTRLMKKERDLQELNNKLTQEVMEMQQQIAEQLRDSINTYLISYNKEKNFELILSNTANDNLLIAHDRYNITQEVTDALNSRFNKKK